MAMTGVSHLLGHHTANRKVTGSFPAAAQGWATSLAGIERQPMMFLSHTLMSLSLFPPPFPSL